jgi:hypothetical protein
VLQLVTAPPASAERRQGAYAERCRNTAPRGTVILERPHPLGRCRVDNFSIQVQSVLIRLVDAGFPQRPFFRDRSFPNAVQ